MTTFSSIEYIYINIYCYNPMCKIYIYFLISQNVI